jgi:hypothetical protein
MKQSYSDDQITQILTELDLDPRDSKMRSVITQILAQKPDVQIDKKFIASLREDLAARAQTFENKNSNKFTFNFFSTTMNKILTSALIVMVVLAGSGVWYIQQTDRPLFKSKLGNSAVEQVLSGKYSVNEAAAESFGDLSKFSIISAEQANNLKPTTQASSQAGGFGGGVAVAKPAELSAAGSAVADEKMIAPGESYPEYKQYKFKYDGGSLPKIENEIGVLKRVKPVQPAGIVSKVISFLSFGLIDLTKLTNPTMSYITFAEDKEFGYETSVDLVQGSVYMGKNWTKWPQDMYNCFEVGCVNPEPLKPSDIPEDEELIAASEQFLAEYGISKEGYGSPVVNNQWRVQYDNVSSAERATFWIPDQAQIIYPLILSGQEVVDESGNKYGLNVNVDVRTKKVFGIYELTSKQFERSNYKSVTDEKRILKVAENGGFRNAMFLEPNVKTVQLKLGTPTIQTVKMWYSNGNNYNNSAELFVPSLVFPIENWKENNYWRQNVIVPLVSDILESDDGGGITPMPMPVDPGIGGTTSSSAGTEAVKPKN